MLAEYIKKLWKNGPLGKTSVNATALNHIEQGVYDNRAAVNSLDNTLTGLQNTVGNMASDVSDNAHDIAVLQDSLEDLADVVDEKFSKDGGTIGNEEGTVEIYGDSIEFSSRDSSIDVGDVLCDDVHASQDIHADGDVTCNEIGGQNTISLRDCFTSASEGKALLAATLTGKGVPTAANATYAQIAYNITKVGKDTVQYLDIGLSFVPDEIIYPS
ncbi:MAG: hypothetical protein IJ794_19735 [Lachnospiraceae bacterium]|nr:hypothetical protein [Lachnospiraceae bacterium]